MSITHAPSKHSAAPWPAKSSVLDVWLSATTYWYLTGLLAALGFSFGFYLVKPATGMPADNRDFRDAFTWMDGKWYKQIATELIRDGLPAARRAKSEHIAEFSLDALDVVRLACPNVAGNPFAGAEPLDAADHYHERVVYLGLAAPILAFFSLTRCRVQRWQWAMAALLLLAFAIALGRSTPVFDFLSTLLPGLKLFRCHGRVFCVATFFVALLAGRGFDALVRGERAARRWEWIGPAVVAWLFVNLVGCSFLESAIDWPRLFDYVRDQAADELAASAILAVDTLAALAFAWKSSSGWRPATAKSEDSLSRPSLSSVDGLGSPSSLQRLAACAIIVAVFLDLGWNNVRNFDLLPVATPSLSMPDLGETANSRFVQGPVGDRVSRGQLQYSRLLPAAVAAGRPLIGTDEGGVLPAATERLFDAVGRDPAAALAVASCGWACSATGGPCEALAEPLPRARLCAVTEE